MIRNVGTIARIGCESGSGFIYAGRIGINMPQSVMDLAERDVRSVSPSAYGGMIVIVRGSSNGSEWLSPELEEKPNIEIPDSMYMRLADRIAASVVESMWIEMVKTRKASYAAQRADAWNMVDYYRAIIQSPRFELLIPNGSAEEILRLLEQRFEKEFGERFWRTKDGE